MTNEEYRILFESGGREVFYAFWVDLLNASGWAGMLPNGWIVDRRYYPEAIPIQENKMMGIAKPKEVN